MYIAKSAWWRAKPRTATFIVAFAPQLSDTLSPLPPHPSPPDLRCFYTFLFAEHSFRYNVVVILHSSNVSYGCMAACERATDEYALISHLCIHTRSELFLLFVLLLLRLHHHVFQSFPTRHMQSHENTLARRSAVAIRFFLFARHTLYRHFFYSLLFLLGSAFVSRKMNTNARTKSFPFDL